MTLSISHPETVDSKTELFHVLGKTACMHSWIGIGVTLLQED